MDVKDHVARFESSQRAKAYLGQAVGRALYGTGWPAHVQAVGAGTYVPEISKALVDAATTQDPASAGLATPTLFSSAFLELVRQVAIVDRLVGVQRAPMNTNVPAQKSDDLPAADWVGETLPMPVAQFSFDTANLPISKVGIILPFTKELASVPAAQGFIERATVGALARGVDHAFLDLTRAPIAGVSPASITYGAPVIASSGDDAAAVQADIAALLAAVSGGQPLRPYLVASSAVALQLATLGATGAPVFPSVGLSGGTVLGVPVLISASAENYLIAIDASAVVVADGGVEIDSAANVSLQMSDTPVPGATSLLSLYQANCIALKAARWVSWARRDDAVAVLDLPFGSPA